MATPTRPYHHAAAFCLLVYTAADGEAEQVWNGRDAAVPVSIRLRNGKPAVHRRWSGDEARTEDYEPPPGTRRFTDLTPDSARARAEHAFDTWAADPRWTGDQIQACRARAVAALAARYLEQAGAVPELTEVPA
jgi:hypothetical protein